jgi:hypothetical protein
MISAASRLQEITVTGSYCYTPEDFAASLAALGAGQLGALAGLKCARFFRAPKPLPIWMPGG